ncbi:MAG: SPOR domain-containing protein [Candidatus Rokubacteria bacterium]|nr:SPOR domain-containing protein [Candidatus Rokubacteria bacterium]
MEAARPADTGRPVETARSIDRARPADTARPVLPREPAPTPMRVAGLPPARASVPVMRAVAAPRGGAYWVQVGAFQDADKAVSVVTALRHEPVSLITAPTQPLLRVVVGPFKDRASAASKLREIRARGYDAFIAEAAN